MPITLQDPCGQCGNDDPLNFRLYRTPQAYIGKYCINCQIEWLKADYLTRESRRASDVSIEDPDVTKEDALYQNIPVKPKVNKAFQVQSARTRVDTRYFADILKPTDHITWHRPKGLWHHSIVTQVNGDKNEIVVIHWSKPRVGSQVQIYEESLAMNAEDGDSLYNQMYRIDYPDDIKRMNKPELVLARARSRIGDVGYGLFSDNCEAFATYCKTGIAKSHQVIWLLEKVKESCGLGNIELLTNHGIQFITKVKSGIPLATGEVVPSEVVQEALSASQGVGAGVIVMIETGFVIWDLSQAYAEREDSTITKNDFVETSVRRIVEGVVSCGFAIGCSIGVEIGIGFLFGLAFGPIGAIVGTVVGGLIGGVAGGAVGRAIGTIGGSFAGKVIANCFPDDKAVLRVNDLTPGDHIVLNGWFLHPRCHAIVVDYRLEKRQREKFVEIGLDGEDEGVYVDDDLDEEFEDETEGEILVIRNTHEHGVVEEWIVFEQPVFKVQYKKGECLDAEQVIKNAKSKLGQACYNLARYNCKTFARECKTHPPLPELNYDTSDDESSDSHDSCFDEYDVIEGPDLMDMHSYTSLKDKNAVNKPT